MTKHIVCKVSEIQEARLTRANIGRAPIVLLRLPSGEIRAFGGRCPHQGAPLEYGCVSGMTSADVPNVLTYDHAGEILRCPWHGFEFSLVNGKPLAPPSTASAMRLRFYQVEVEGDDVVVET